MYKYKDSCEEEGREKERESGSGRERESRSLKAEVYYTVYKNKYVYSLDLFL